MSAITLTNVGALWGHRVACEKCQYRRVHSNVNDAISDYRTHACEPPLRLEDFNLGTDQ